MTFALQLSPNNRRLLAPLLIVASALALLVSPLQAATSLDQYGITWTFSADRPTGQYANGDYWVVGPVTITSITPASTVVDGVTKNGSQLNPVVAGDQGYDSRPGDMAYNASKNAARPGGNDLSATNPLTITTGSLVSSISLEAASPRPQLQTVAILTVVAEPPAAGAFRPPPVGSDKTSYWNKSSLNYGILKSLAPVASTPPLATVAGYFERPWTEQNPGWTARYIHAKDNQPEYGRDMAHRLALGLLSLHLNYTNAQKELLYLRLVQYGIDVYGTVKAGGVYEDLGGHNQGRKMPLILAGLALNDPNIMAYADAAKQFVFQEDRQTWYIAPADVGRALYTVDKRPREPYLQEDVGIAEWGEQHKRQPVRDGRNWDAYYRDICFSSEMGHALMAKLTPGAVAAWNWPAFHDYMQRAYKIASPKASGSANTIQPFVKEMWEAYAGTANAGSDSSK